MSLNDVLIFLTWQIHGQTDERFVLVRLPCPRVGEQTHPVSLSPVRNPHFTSVDDQIVSPLHSISVDVCKSHHVLEKIFRREREKERERKMFYLMMHSTHFIYSYMVSDIWLRTTQIVRKKTRCLHIGYSYRLPARVLLYAPSHRQDNTYHGLCYTSRGALAGMRKSSMGPPHEGSIRPSCDRKIFRMSPR